MRDRNLGEDDTYYGGDGDDFVDLQVNNPPAKHYYSTQVSSGSSSSSSSSGGRTLLDTITDPAAKEFEFTGISQAYDELLIEGTLRSLSAVTVADVSCYINSDTTAVNYHRQNQIANSGVHNVNDASSGDALSIQIAGATSPSGSEGFYQIKFPHYTSAYLKGYRSEYGFLSTSTTIYSGHRTVFHKTTTAAITTILLQQATSNMTGELKLYGVTY